jgi:hypothetical protein
LKQSGKAARGATGPRTLSSPSHAANVGQVADEKGRTQSAKAAKSIIQLLIAGGAPMLRSPLGTPNPLLRGEKPGC